MSERFTLAPVEHEGRTSAQVLDNGRPIMIGWMPIDELMKHHDVPATTLFDFFKQSSSSMLSEQGYVQSEIDEILELVFPLMMTVSTDK